MKVLLIIPSFNEEENVLKNYSRILDYNKKFKTHFDAIVIDDGSNDKTKEICIKNNVPHISLLHNLGIGGAVQTGYKYAYLNGYDIAVQFDGDGQHDINYVKDIIKPIEEKKADMVIGSRFVDKKSSSFKSTKSRQLGINLISFFIKLVTGKKIYDTTSGFRAVNRDLIKIFSDYYPSEYPEPVSTVVVLKNNFKVEEVAVSMKERVSGKSSIHSWKNAYYMINVILSILVTRGDYRK